MSLRSPAEDENKLSGTERLRKDGTSVDQIPQ